MVPVLITRDELLTRQASDAISALTRLVEAGTFDPPPVLRDVFAEFAAAVARADRRRPEPEPPFAVERA